MTGIYMSTVGHSRTDCCIEVAYSGAEQSRAGLSDLLVLYVFLVSILGDIRRRAVKES